MMTDARLQGIADSRLKGVYDNRPAEQAICELVQEVKRLRAENRIRSNYMSRLPFCPDHRDKVAGLSCRQCEIERLRNAVIAYLDRWDRSGPLGSAQWEKFDEVNRRLRMAIEETNTLSTGSRST